VIPSDVEKRRLKLLAAMAYYIKSLNLGIDKNQVIVKELLFLYCTSSSFVIVYRILQIITV
jgi:hypothetical protein